MCSSRSQRRTASRRGAWKACAARRQREIAALPTPRVAVMLGGPNAAYRFGAPKPGAAQRSHLPRLSGLARASWSPASRRTPASLMEAVKQATEGAPRILLDGTNDNPYAPSLAHADVLIVTANSVNMTGEACATSRPVYVLEPEGGSAKFTRFHDALQRYGEKRTLPVYL